LSLSSRTLDAPDAVAALAPGRSVSRGELCAGAGHLAREIGARFDPQGRHTTLGFSRSPLALAAALLASWRAGRAALLPDHGRREAVGPLALHGSTGLFVHDTGTGRGLGAATLRNGQEGGGEGTAATPATEFRPTLFAAGSRDWGASQAEARAAPRGLEALGFVAWGPERLAAELEGLAAGLGGGGRGPWLSTLAPCSPPAALAGVLLPLHLGRPFVDRVPLGRAGLCPAAVGRTVSDCEVRALVTSPQHLLALLGLDPGILRPVDTVLVLGGELDGALAEAFAHRHGVRPSSHWAREPGPGAELSRLCSTVVAAGLARDVAGGRAADGTPLLLAAAADGARLGEGLERLAPGVRWTVVESLPRDPNGRLDDAVLRRHFGFDAAGGPLELDFRWTAEGTGAELQVPTDSAWFAGHFPGTPVLAGAVQLEELVLPALVRHLGRVPRIGGWSALKFLAPIAPGDQLQLQFGALRDGSVIDFAIERAGLRCTQGRVHLQRDEARR
jgi:hypothetical protein